MGRNSYFRFKEFQINQDKSAMKVCTDACVFGAWVNVGGSKKVLDIGAGTGLLSLMVAQRFPLAKIDAVEIDSSAFEQAVVNVAESPFKDQVRVVKSSIQKFTSETTYDFIFSNPPFFQNDLKSPDSQANKAHHSDTLSFEELEIATSRLLSNDGSFAILLPLRESIVYERLAIKCGWYVWESLELVHEEGKPVFRRMLILKKIQKIEEPVLSKTLYIHNRGEKSYTNDFMSLLKSYYLAF